MENNQNPIEAARTNIETARQAYSEAQTALSDFCGPFEQKEASLEREVYKVRAELGKLRKGLSGVLEDEDKAQEYEAEIEKAEKKLNRLTQRLELAQDWRKRESEALGKLQEEEQAASTALQNAFLSYAYAWVGHVKRARANYLEALRNYWREAPSRIHEVQFPRFEWRNLEINDVTIRNYCGPIKW